MYIDKNKIPEKYDKEIEDLVNENVISNIEVLEPDRDNLLNDDVVAEVFINSSFVASIILNKGKLEWHE